MAFLVKTRLLLFPLIPGFRRSRSLHRPDSSYPLCHSSVGSSLDILSVSLVSIMQIVTGIKVNSEVYFPKLREYCPSAEGTRAIFPQLREIRLTIDR